MTKEREILDRLRDGYWHRGLELVKASEAEGGKLGRVTIYVHLARLEEAGFVLSRYEDAPVDPNIGIARREYSITSRGRAALLRDDL